MKQRILLKLICESSQLVSQIVVVICLVSISFTHEFIIDDNSVEHNSMAHNHSRTRQGRCKCVRRHLSEEPSYLILSLDFFFFIWSGFPFYTIGRFQNAPCVGSNQLMGTCVLAGECTTDGGIATGSCNSITRQAVCCVCK